MKIFLFILLLISNTILAQENGTVPLAGPIGTIGTDDTYPTHLSIRGKGGLMSVADITARNAIPTARRQELMLVGVVSDQKVYQLKGGTTNSDWIEFSSGNSLIFNSPLVNTSGTVDLPAATTSVDGYLSSTDWNTFNNKASTASLSSYLPLTGGTLSGALTGTTATFNSVAIPVTSSSSVGVIKQGSQVLLHTSNLGGANQNIFLGIDAGNFTNNATSGIASNIGIGTNALSALTTGYKNIYVGSPSGGSITTGFNNIMLGSGLYGITTGSGNTILGGKSVSYSNESNIIALNSGDTQRALFDGTEWFFDSDLTVNGIVTATNIPFKGTYSTTGSATTTFTVTIGQTMANTDYIALPVATNTLSAVTFSVQNKTTTTFDIVVTSGLTGAVAYDFIINP